MVGPRDRPDPGQLLKCTVLEPGGVTTSNSIALTPPGLDPQRGGDTALVDAIGLAGRVGARPPPPTGEDKSMARCRSPSPAGLEDTARWCVSAGGPPPLQRRRWLGEYAVEPWAWVRRWARNLAVLLLAAAGVAAAGRVGLAGGGG